ncbi:MAG: cytochrome C oxidase subunit I, partial [Chloroflexaceae bacterium]
LWIIGMILFSHFMHMLGLAGMPRRTMIGSAPYVLPEWEGLLPFTMIGGLLMFASALCFLVNVLMTLTAGKRVEPGPVTFARALSGPEDVPLFLDRLTPWVLSAIVLVAINYGPTLYFLATTGRFNIPGLSPW